jgi:hypothetical protein
MVVRDGSVKAICYGDNVEECEQRESETGCTLLPANGRHEVHEVKRHDEKM